MIFKKNNLRARLTVLFGILFFLYAFFFPDPSPAEMPQQIFFQTKVTKSDKSLLSGAHSFVFKMYTAASGGTAVWTETQSLTPDSAGIVSCYLGSVTAFPSSLYFNTTYYLGIDIDSDGEMTPRVKIVPAACALNANYLDALDSTQFLRSDTADTMKAP